MLRGVQPVLKAAICFAACVALSGCRRDLEIQSDYGNVRLGRSAKTVDGLDVISDMFGQNGFEVEKWRRLSPRLTGRQRMSDDPDYENAVRAIVWAPNRFEMLSEEQLLFLGQWVDEGGTLILIGRDYDPISDYWRRVLPRIKGSRFPDALRKAMLARSKHDLQRDRASDLNLISAVRFEKQSGDPRVTSLTGPWAKGIDVTQMEVESTLKMVLTRPNSLAIPLAQPGLSPAEEEILELDIDSPVVLQNPVYQSLLSSDRGELVVRVSSVPIKEEVASHNHVIMNDDFGSGPRPPGKILVVANGSFVFNLALVNLRHSDLAQRLVNACGSSGRVAFMDSEVARVKVYESEPDAAHIPPRIEPLATILDHIVVMGVLICFVLAPIFGRPKEYPKEQVSDFGKHLEAVGELLEKTRDVGYAERQIADYEELTRKEDRSKPPPAV